MKNRGSKEILIAAKDKLNGSVLVSLLRAAALQLSVGAAAALLSRVAFVKGIFPFGLAFIVGVSDRYAVSALVGFVLNNWIGGVSADSTVYVAAVGVVAALRWILAGISKKSFRKSNYLPSLIAASVTVIFTESTVMALSGTFTWANSLNVLAGLCIVGAFSYFYSVSFDALKRRRSLPEFSSIQKACLSLALASVLMSLMPINVGPFSLGRFVSSAVVIFAAHLLASPFDMVVAGAVGAAVILSEPAFAFAAVGFCVSGSIASLFKKRGRAMLCLVYVISAAIFAICAESYVYAITYLAETLFGALVFLIVPIKSAAEVKFDLINDSLNSATSAVGMKLDCISSSMRDITTLLDKTVEVKDARCNMDKLYNRVAEKVCKQCPLMSYCWVKHFDDTTASFNKMTPILLSKGDVTREDVDTVFTSRCMSVPSVLREVNACYKGYLDYIAKIKNTQLYKGMLKKQFLAVSTMLDSARNELSAIKEWDEQKSKRVYDCAARLSLPVETASVVYGYEHRPTVTVTFSDSPPSSMIKRLSAGITMITGSTLSAPLIETAKGSTIVCYTEQPSFSIKTAVSQVCADGDICGDVYSVFTDLNGDVHMLLSDGMGTGKSAAKDGAICCAFLKRLMESGFPIKQAAELANTALALRETNESASTLDAFSFNVYTGAASLFKAGAAPTYCLHGSRVETIGGRTLPVGILEYVLCRETNLALYDGDIVVMASDGAEHSQNPFIEQTLKLMYDHSAEDICKELVTRAKSNHNASDDITILVAKIAKN